MKRSHYRIILVLFAISSLFYILFMQPRVKCLNQASNSNIMDFKIQEDYLIGQNYIREGAVPAVLKKAYFVDKNGQCIESSKLPFDWDIWVAERPTYGALHVTAQELAGIVKRQIENHPLVSQTFALVLHVKPKFECKKTHDYYLMLEYEMLGVRKHTIKKAITM